MPQKKRTLTTGSKSSASPAEVRPTVADVIETWQVGHLTPPAQAPAVRAALPPLTPPHPAQALLTMVAHGPRLAHTAEAEAWRASQQPLIAAATRIAAATEQVLAAHATYMDPVVKILRWHDPMQKRTHMRWVHLDRECELYRGATRMIAQLRTVERQVLEVSITHPDTRESAMATVRRLVKNAEGYDQELERCVIRVQDLLAQLADHMGVPHERTVA